MFSLKLIHIVNLKSITLLRKLTLLLKYKTQFHNIRLGRFQVVNIFTNGSCLCHLETSYDEASISDDDCSVGFFSSLPVFACNTQMRIRNQTSSSTFRIVDTRSNVRNQISNHVHMIRYIPRTSRNSMRPAGMIHTRRGK